MHMEPQMHMKLCSGGVYGGGAVLSLDGRWPETHDSKDHLTGFRCVRRGGSMSLLRTGIWVTGSGVHVEDSIERVPGFTASRPWVLFRSRCLVHDP